MSEFLATAGTIALVMSLALTVFTGSQLMAELTIAAGRYIHRKIFGN